MNEEVKIDVAIADLPALVDVGVPVNWQSFSTADKLDALAGLKDYRTILAIDIDQRIAALEAQRSAITGPIDEDIAGLESAIKADVLAAGATVKGARCMAVYSKPRVTWDGTKLDGYMAAHPEIAAFRKVGEASVTIRVSGK
jgi:hypothetical protein